VVLSRVRLALWAGAVLIVAQGLAIGRVELTFDEAYYALWARWPQAGYLDHPPMVAWWIAASQAMFGPGEFGVRALFWAAGAVLPALVFALGRRLYGDTETAATATLFYLGAPLAAGAPLATPDTPLVFFWTLALLGLVEVWRGSSWGWALVGLAAGAAGLSKMTAGFLGLGIVLALVAVPSLRRQFARPGPYGAATLALAVLSPFLWWNATHGFATFLKQGGRLAARGFAPRYLGEFLGSQLLLFNPLTAAVALRGAVAKRGAPDEATRLLMAISAPLLGYFLLHALHDRVQGNWPAPLYPALAVLAARAVSRRWAWLAVVSSGVGVALTGALYFHLATGQPRLGAPDPALRIGGWRDLAARVSGVARDRKAEFIMAQGYAQTSLLQYYSGHDVFEIGEPERWTFRPRFESSGVGVAFGRREFEPELRRLFANVTPLSELRRTRFGIEVDDFFVFEVQSPKSSEQDE
jgi:4-amino-4-deoxy-L-arabinose transferase-like glycosyltransferase